MATMPEHDESLLRNLDAACEDLRAVRERLTQRQGNIDVWRQAQGALAVAQQLVALAHQELRARLSQVPQL